MTSGSTETIQVGALSVRFLVEAGRLEWKRERFECFVPADSKMPAPHSHDAFEETIYGLEGTTTWTVDGQDARHPPGEAVCIPRGAVHGFDNNGTEDAKFLAISTPGVMTPDYSVRSTTRSRRLPGVRPTKQRSRRSCAGTA